MASRGKSPAESQALEFVDQAISALNSFRLFNRNAKYEEAAELFSKAAAQYKIAKMWDEAGNTYAKAAENCIQSKNEHEATTNFVNAAKCFKTAGNKKDANKMYDLASQRLQENNKFASAAKLLKEVGEMEEEAGRLEDAAEAYSKAADMYQAEDSPTSANQMLIKVADLAALQEDYKRAIPIYERVAHSSLDNNLTRWSATDYLFKAGLCTMALGAKTNDSTGVTITDALERYQAMSSQFSQSRECQLLVKLASAISGQNVDEFADAVADYDTLYKLDKWKINVLLSVRKSLENPSDAGPNLS